MRDRWDVLTLALNAPLVGVEPRQRSRPLRLHAVTMEAVIAAWPKDERKRRRVRFTSACGVDGVACLGIGDVPLVLWPPAVKGLPCGYERCVECHRATGRKRPRVDIVASVGDQQ